MQKAKNIKEEHLHLFMSCTGITSTAVHVHCVYHLLFNVHISNYSELIQFIKLPEQKIHQKKKILYIYMYLSD